MSRFTPIISIILLVFLLVGGIFFWWPKYQEFKQQRMVLANKIKALKQKNDYYSGLENLSQKLTSYREDFEKIDSALPAEPSLPVILNFIEKASSENGLILDNINPPEKNNTSRGMPSNAKPSENSEIGKVSLFVSLTGSYPALKNFLSLIYKNSRMIEVNSISFSYPENKDLKERNFFNFDLSLEAHILSIPEATSFKTASSGVTP